MLSALFSDQPFRLQRQSKSNWSIWFEPIFQNKYCTITCPLSVRTKWTLNFTSDQRHNLGGIGPVAYQSTRDVIKRIAFILKPGHHSRQKVIAQKLFMTSDDVIWPEMCFAKVISEINCPIFQSRVTGKNLWFLKKKNRITSNDIVGIFSLWLIMSQNWTDL